MCFCLANFIQMARQDIHPRPTDMTVLYLCTCIGIGSLTRCFLKNITIFKIRFPYTAVLLIIGMLFGIISLSSSTVKQYSGVIPKLDPIDLIAILFPPLIFKTAFQLDFHVFLKSVIQMLTMSILGFSFVCITMGLVMMYVVPQEWSLNWALTLGIIAGATDTKEVSVISEQFKSLGALLVGEEMITSSTSLLLHQVLAYAELETLNIEPDVLTTFKILAPIAMGLVVGKLFIYFLSWERCDFSTHVSFSLSVSYALFYSMHVILGASGIFTLIVFGLFVSCNKKYITSELEHSLMEFWELLYTLFNYVLYIEAGLLLVQICTKYGEISDVICIIFAYLICILSRYLTFLCMSPLLNHIGYGFHWKNGVFVAWGGLRGTTSLSLACSMYLQDEIPEEVAEKIALYVIGLVLLNVIINGATLHVMVRILGLSSISTAKISNMDNAMSFVMSTRDRAINMLKMNRLFADANWVVIRNATRILHPYKFEFKHTNALTRQDIGDHEDVLGRRYARCPSCQKTIFHQPTAKEYVEMTKEARLRILKARKVSYGRQREQGLLTKEGYHVLVGAVEDAMEKESKEIHIQVLRWYWMQKGLTIFLRNRLVSVMPKNVQFFEDPPSTRCRFLCYKMATSLWWDYGIFVVVLIHLVVIVLDCIYRPRIDSITGLILLITTCFIFVVLFASIVIKALGMGCLNFLKSFWDFIDVLTVITTFFYIVFVIKFHYDYRDSHDSSEILIGLSASRSIHLIRFLRMVVVIRGSVPKIIAYLDKKVDSQLSCGFDIGKGFVTGESEVLKLLPRIVDDKNICSVMKEQMEESRLEVTKEIGILQRNRPTIAITMKTRQSMIAVLRVMKEAVIELKDGGLLDDQEYRKLSDVIYDQQKLIRRQYLSISPCPPEVLLRQVPWLIDDDEAADFLMVHSMMVNLNYEEFLIKVNDHPQGIYIIVSGLVRMSYIPDLVKLQELEQKGALPNVDYPTSVMFRDRQEDYILSGNVIGEIGLLTNRTYDTTITCESSVQAYFISIDVMKDVMKATSDMHSGIELRMWKTVSVRLACIILMSVPAYQSYSQEKIQFLLERAFVPFLGSAKTLLLNDLMEAVLLIEGQAFDMSNKDMYYGPSYVPKTVQRLVFSKSSYMNADTDIEPKLLIIPVKDVDEEDIIDLLEESGDVIYDRSYANSQHTLPTGVSKMTNKRGSKHRTKRNVFGFRKIEKVHRGTISWQSASSSLFSGSAADTEGTDQIEVGATQNPFEKSEEHEVVRGSRKRGSETVEELSKEQLDKESSSEAVDKIKEASQKTGEKKSEPPVNDDNTGSEKKPIYRLSYIHYAQAFHGTNDYAAGRDTVLQSETATSISSDSTEQAVETRKSSKDGAENKRK